MAPRNNPGRRAGITRRTHAATTAGQPSSSRAGPPLAPGRHYGAPRCPACPGEPARPAVDVVSAVEHRQRLAGHGPVVDEPVRQLEAGRRHPLERLVQGWRRVTHLVLLLPPVNPCRSGSRVEVPLPARGTASAACPPGYGAVYSVAWAPRTSPQPALPAILVDKDEGARGSE